MINSFSIKNAGENAWNSPVCDLWNNNVRLLFVQDWIKYSQSAGNVLCVLYSTGESRALAKRYGSPGLF